MPLVKDPMETVTSQRRSQTFCQAFPKVELHRHLEGSLRLSTLVELGRAHGLNIPTSMRELTSLVQVNEHEPLTFTNFLSKFNTLRLFFRSPEVIQRVTREAIVDAAADKVRYMELRFMPVALSQVEGFPLSEVIDWVIKATRTAEEENGIKTRLIVGVNRHETQQAEEVIQLAMDRVSSGSIVAVDLAGNEAEFSAQPFVGMFREAHQTGLHVTVHAGEWGGAANVSEAIQHLGAERIGHGVRVMEDDNVVRLAQERDIPFEVCITSNYQSGVVPALTAHPLPRMIEAGINTTINTDNPSISRITLGNEYQIVCEDLGIPQEVFYERLIAAAQAAFLPQAERDTLAQSLREEIESMGC
ncbi:MAG: adenosine deaminase [Anaerolineales bacterium]|nr:adenosine deaminase [Anaerolineales bacterium]